MSQYLTFTWPWMLLALLGVPLMIWFYFLLRKRQTQTAVDLGPLGLAQDRGGRPLERLRHVPPILFLLGLTLLLFSLARPQALVSLPRIQGTVVLAFDVSNSMMADDLEPARLDAAKEAAQAFVEEQPGTILIGVVAFGNGGLIVQQPTHDRVAILSSIERLSIQGGTSLGQGIFTSLNAIAGERITIGEEAVDVDTGAIDTERLQLDDYSSAVILLLTDGENTSEPAPMEIAQLAAEAGVRIYTIGIGSQDGALIEIDGFTLATQLDETLLQEIANVTNGVYFRAQDRETLNEIYENVDLQLTVDAEMMEVTAIVAGISLLFLLAGALASMFWLGRAP
jgi:Ca-activated chloride channel family protein